MNQDQKRHGQSGRARRPLYDQNKSAGAQPEYGAPASPSLREGPAPSAPPAGRPQQPYSAQRPAQQARRGGAPVPAPRPAGPQAGPSGASRAARPPQGQARSAPPAPSQRPAGAGPAQSTPPTARGGPARTAPGAASPREGSAQGAQPVRPRLSSGGAAVRGGVPPVSARTAARRKKRARVRRIVLSSVCALVYLVMTGLFTAFTWVSEEIKGENTDAGAVSAEVKSNKLPQYKGKNIICGLICGIDYNNDAADGYLDPTKKVGNTDMIMYMMYNTKTDECNVLTIPRDVYVGPDVPSGIGKINGVYYYASDPENRMDALAQVLMDQLQLPTDFYVTIDMDGLKEIVSIKGSIEVYVSRDVIKYDDYGNVLSHIEPGWRSLGPEETEFFLRNRNYEGADIDRLKMQQSFYSALFREFKSLAPADLPSWMNVLLYRCKVGGISPLQIMGLALEALSLDSANLTFVRPPVTGARQKTGTNSAGEPVYSDFVSLVPDETAELLNEYFRPDGHTVPVDELNIYTLPVFEAYGKYEASIRSMADVEETEPDKAA